MSQRYLKPYFRSVLACAALVMGLFVVPAGALPWTSAVPAVRGAVQEQLLPTEVQYRRVYRQRRIVYRNVRPRRAFYRPVYARPIYRPFCRTVYVQRYNPRRGIYVVRPVRVCR